MLSTDPGQRPSPSAILSGAMYRPHNTILMNQQVKNAGRSKEYEVSVYIIYTLFWRMNCRTWCNTWAINSVSYRSRLMRLKMKLWRERSRYWNIKQGIRLLFSSCLRMDAKVWWHEFSLFMSYVAFLSPTFSENKLSWNQFLYRFYEIYEQSQESFPYSSFVRVFRRGRRTISSDGTRRISIWRDETMGILIEITSKRFKIHPTTWYKIGSYAFFRSVRSCRWYRRV